MQESESDRSKLESRRLRPLWVAVIIDVLGFSIVLPFLPYFVSEYNATPLVTGLLLSSNAIVGFFCGPMLARISDRYGRKKILQVAQGGTIFAFLLLAFSRNLVMLFLARIIDGMFSGQLPIAKATVGDVVSPKDRSKHMTNIGLAFTLASLIGPALGAFLSKFGTLGPGLVAACLAIASFVFTAVRFEETLPQITKIEEFWHKIDESIKNQSESLHKNHKAVYLLTQYWFLVFAATIFQTSLSMFGLFRLNLVQTQIGLLFTAMGIFQVIFRAFVFNPMRKALGDTRTAFIGLLSFIVAFILLRFVVSPLLLVIVLIIFSFAGACSRGIITGFTSRVVDHRNQGKINGLTSALDSLGQMIGPIIGSLSISAADPTLYSTILLCISLISFGMIFHVKSFEFDKKTGIPNPQS